MNPWRWVDPRLSSVRVENVQTYLLSKGWKKRPSPNPNTLIFEKLSKGGKQAFLQAMPSSEEFSDFSRHIAETITTLSEIEDRHPRSEERRVGKECRSRWSPY